MYSGRSGNNGIVATFVSVVIAAIISIASLITHVVVCINDENWILLIIGVLAAPVGIIHGIGSWFGVW